MIRFVDMGEDVALDEDVFHTPWYCIPCHDWCATKAVVNEDDTWYGYACCDNEEHAAWALRVHLTLAAGGEQPGEFS